jgi:DNA ligase (NAD+)
MARQERRIRSCQQVYYNGLPGNPDISDAEFDALYDGLSRKNPKSPVLAKVGAAPVKGFPKAPHIIPMGSQEKAANPSQFLYWAAKTAPSSYVVQYKLDGASLELQYHQGLPTRAVTRGNDVIGNDITQNARLMIGVLPESGIQSITHRVHLPRRKDKSGPVFMEKTTENVPQRTKEIVLTARPVPGPPVLSSPKNKSV